MNTRANRSSAQQRSLANSRRRRVSATYNDDLVAAAIAKLTPALVAEYRASDDKLNWVHETFFPDMGIDRASKLIDKVEDAIDAFQVSASLRARTKSNMRSINAALTRLEVSLTAASKLI